jgi:hypothetical protein
MMAFLWAWGWGILRSICVTNKPLELNKKFAHFSLFFSENLL